MIQSRLLLALTCVAAIACGHPRLDPIEAGGPQLITQDQIEHSQAITAYDAIQKLRANFLSYRGETSLNNRGSQPYPSVYLDGQPYGAIASLRTIPASQVATIRLYRSSEATTQFGTGNMGGVIAVTTRRGGP